MSKEDRDILDNMFRAKLYDHEVDTTPDDWEMIVNRLPESKPVVRTLRRLLYWSGVAAVAALLMITGIFLFTENPMDSGLADHTGTEILPTPVQKDAEISSPVVSEPDAPLVAKATEPASSTETPVSTQRRVISGTEQVLTITGEPTIDSIQETPTHSKELVVSPDENKKQESQPVITQSSNTLIADAGYTTSVSKTKSRRWGVGMGGGSLTANAHNTFNGLVHQVSTELQRDDDMMMMNAPIKSADYETELTHRTPVNLGLSAAYYLNNRWALQFGLSYSLLVSETKQNTVYHRNEEQRLHYLGIPVSLSYKIAEWNSLQVYAAAGFMPEINVAGKFKVKKWADVELGPRELIQSNTESMRMRELYWSVNARGGVSYPLFRYMNAFAEVGAAYYFDNGSSIQTIHSEKPFNVSFNFGLRFGF